MRQNENPKYPRISLDYVRAFALSHYRALPSGCWEWTAYRQPRGYGHYGPAAWVEGHELSTVAHRLVYHLLRGPVPRHLQIDHLCRNKWCVNPDHLEPVTARENTLRGDTIPTRHLKKTHCIRGHQYSESNIRWVYRKTSVGFTVSRNCRQCERDRPRRLRAGNLLTTSRPSR